MRHHQHQMYGFEPGEMPGEFAGNDGRRGRGRRRGGRHSGRPAPWDDRRDEGAGGDDRGDTPEPGRGRRGGPYGRGRDGGRGPGRHGGPREHRRHGGRGGRAQRGDVRAAVLLLLAEEPMHGYQLMHAIADRTAGAWRPSAGAIYPTIAQLEDEGLVVTSKEGGRRLVTLTDIGEQHVAEQGSQLGDPFTAFTSRAAGVDLRGALGEVQAAVRQLSVSGDNAQREAAAKILAETKRSLYLILAGEPGSEDAPR